MKATHNQNTAFKITQPTCQVHSQNVCQYLKLSTPFINNHSPVNYRPSSTKLSNPKKQKTMEFACEQCYKENKERQYPNNRHCLHDMMNR